MKGAREFLQLLKVLLAFVLLVLQDNGDDSVCKEAGPHQDECQYVVDLLFEEETPHLRAHSTAVEALHSVPDSVNGASQVYDYLQGLEGPKGL